MVKTYGFGTRTGFLGSQCLLIDRAACSRSETRLVALALPTETALEGIMQSRARTIETAFATLTEKEVEGLAAEML